MPTISIFFAVLAACFHVVFFLMESVFWMNPKAHRNFGIPNLEMAEQFRLTYFNQGFYNLFLAIGIFSGMIFLQSEDITAGKTLILFCCATMFGASVVLFVSKPGMLRGVFIQGLAPLSAIVSWWIFR